MKSINKTPVLACLLVFPLFCFSQSRQTQSFIIKNDIRQKTISFGNSKMQLTLDYNGKANISSLTVNGEEVIQGNAGIYSEIKTGSAVYSTLQTNTAPKILVEGNTVKLRGIAYGDRDLGITENWVFIINKSDIVFDMDRTLSKKKWLEESASPRFDFKSIHTWEGAFQGFGGLAWFYLFNEKLCTYGVHTHTANFWNSKSGNGLKVDVNAPDQQVAMKYSRTNDDQLAYSITVSDHEMLARFDAGTNRRRFIRQGTDVWSRFEMGERRSAQRITLSYFDFNKTYGRGKFAGINGAQVSAILNTVARIGVIDAKLFGGNSWHTPYGPICLHEQYIAQIGLAVNDSAYLKGYAQALDFYRDHAVRPDGRVISRWAYDNSDAMPGQTTEEGFYEAQWGYLMDSNPDLVTNVSELYDQTGDIGWVKSQQQSCEKVLDWIIKRDSDGDGLVEMMTDSEREKKGSDWLDIVWASYENAFVNANLYHALVKWAAIEQQLGNADEAKAYGAFAEKLKTSFNKPVSAGGFWDEEKGCYVHWLDKDGSAHGRNMVTPVNFMAIAYGICDDDGRRKIILDGIEKQMQKEKLFFWPITMSSYAPGECREDQFPFPAYENGDLFLSWGSVAVKAYAAYDPELALKYVKNVMDRYSQDGLAFQRYGRIKQNGLGDDILSGNCLSVVGLYEAIYGINPLYNRFYLDPHITKALSGTELKYNFRGQQLTIGLNLNRYSVSNGRYKIISSGDFGFYGLHNELSFFHADDTAASLKVKTTPDGRLTLNIRQWEPRQMEWIQSSENKQPRKLGYILSRLRPDSEYLVAAAGRRIGHFKTDHNGSFAFNYKTSVPAERIVVSSIE
ncbi:MAG: trehalase family glycosidase [Bacteroidota bacterium]|nr:trehalase family glycosidase [Bacteroidota bacterium]